MKQITDDQYNQYQAMCKAAKIKESELKKWKPKKQSHYFNRFGETLNGPGQRTAESGISRSTKALCKIASNRTIRANLISAWLDEFGSGEQEYDNNKTLNYIYFREGKWRVGPINNCYSPDTVYMTLEDAKAICKALNEGIIDLKLLVIQTQF